MFDIIICTYNGSKIISRSIESILKQNKYLDLVKNLYIVDNNSKDRTKEMVLKYEKVDRKIKYLFQPKQGLSNARLKGVQNASSDWIIFIDDDNILDQNWLINAKNFIDGNPKIGVFNGAVYPLIEEELSEKEKINLKIAYKGLACTHLKKEDIDFEDKNHPCGLPFGAGLVILSEELKELSRNGWLQSEGRKGEKLISGEDSEMVEYILGKNYLSGYEPKCTIKHLIGRNRLKEEYLVKLFKSFRKYSKSKTMKNHIKILIRELIAKILLIVSNNNYEKTLKLKLTSFSLKESFCNKDKKNHSL